MRDFYTCFYKELVSIDQVITSGETIRAFFRPLQAKGTALFDSWNVIHISTVEEMTTRVKSYIDHEEKKLELCPHKNNHGDSKSCPMVLHFNREVYETFAPPPT